jgi:hypothetical protein
MDEPDEHQLLATLARALTQERRRVGVMRASAARIAGLIEGFAIAKSDDPRAQELRQIAILALEAFERASRE